MKESDLKAAVRTMARDYSTLALATSYVSRVIETRGNPIPIVPSDAEWTLLSQLIERLRATVDDLELVDRWVTGEEAIDEAADLPKAA